MKQITKNTVHSKGDKQCKNRYNERRIVEKGVTTSNALLLDRCKISAIHSCTFPQDSEKTCPLVK